jgi:hypothetical protein
MCFAKSLSERECLGGLPTRAAVRMERIAHQKHLDLVLTDKPTDRLKIRRERSAMKRE